ncbi:MAG: SDR family oxidoreductase [Alphaproteobacteria bacterium]|nr:SDR family oxidoreductase [Alphaproteobacteria bacterium]
MGERSRAAKGGRVTGTFAGRVALVSGGSGGVGRAVAADLARAGADVALTSHSHPQRAEQAAAAVRQAGRRALVLPTDLRDASATEKAVARTVAELGRLDVLVHAAGGDVDWAPVRDIQPQGFADFIAIDLVGAFNVIQPAVRHMHGAGGGAVVAISSIAAQMCQSRNSQGAASKAGLEALIRVIAREEGRYGIRANAVSIGLTDTEQARLAFERWGPKATEQVIAGIPLQRIARPEEVARMVLFLAGEEGGYVTGKVIQVDGGQIIAA